MSKWILWLVLAGLTGSPLLSLLILLVIWWTLDRFTLQILPDPLRGVMRWRRASHLRATLANNPNDRRARYELADIYVQQRRHGAAFELLKANLEAGDDDVPTLYLLGVAARGAGDHDRAIRILEASREEDPDYRLGDADLQLARAYLAKDRVDDAREALERLLARRRSSVEARFFLAQIYARTGDAEAARRTRREAWDEHASAPRYQQRRSRIWAWRANPARPAVYAAFALAAALAFATLVAPALRNTSAAYSPGMMLDE